MTFWSRRKNGLIRRISLTSKFLTSQPAIYKQLQYILPNISQSKSNQTVKFGPLIQDKYFSLKIMQKMRQGD